MFAPMSAMSNTSIIDMFTVSVRALADFNQTQGNLIGMFRPSPSAFEGQQTHQLTQANRDQQYRAEVSLSAEWQGRNFGLRISGRADGVFENGVEEIKTSRIPADEIPQTAKLQHRIQARIYAGLLMLSEKTDERLEVKVTYVHPQTLQQWSESEYLTTTELLDYFTQYCARYDAWLQLVFAQQLKRNSFINVLNFPYPTMRNGQRQMAESVYKACYLKKHLTVEAPTGTGKTLAALFPALKSMPKAKTQCLFFLTMKTTGRVAAAEALAKLDPTEILTTVFLSAKTRLCLKTDAPCDGDYCPYAQNYYGKREHVRPLLFSQTHWHDTALKALGEQEQICPYYLSQDWAIWSNIVVADLNYIYDTTAVQPHLLKEIDNKATLLIDESHNLIDRGRMIFSGEFSGEFLQKLILDTPKSVQRHLKKMQTALRKACKDSEPVLTETAPSQLCQTLRDFVAQSPVIVRENPSFEPNADWQELIFQCARFVRLHELANSVDFRWRYHSGRPDERRVELICLSPAALLKNKHDLVHNVIAFSATLKPWGYSNVLNGLQEAVVEELPSPFLPAQYQVYIANDISTRFNQRSELPVKLRQTLEVVINSPKNSMVFFSSYQQLKACTGGLSSKDQLIIQQSGWSNADRDNLLDRFKNEQGLTLMTVLGGVFSEGIDLPGVQLEQVIVVGPGLPQVNDVNNAIKQQMDQLNVTGFDYAYVFPGLHKVLQAAGRCIRTEQDLGQILLIDDRFERYRINQWLPNYWTTTTGPLTSWSSIETMPPT